MSTPDWTAAELDPIPTAEELEITPLDADGDTRRTVPIWVGRAGDEPYVRSWRGIGGGWFRGVRASHAARVRAAGVERDVALVDAADDLNDVVDAAYRPKYSRYPSYVDPMVASEARATTLKLLPREREVRS